MTADTSNLASLRAIATLPLGSGPTDKAITLRGLTSDGDGGEGVFIWFPTCTEVDDDGGIFVKPNDRPTTDPGRWKRVTRPLRTFHASQIGILPTNTPAANSAAYDAWRTNVDDDHTASTLLFDKVGH